MVGTLVLLAACGGSDPASSDGDGAVADTATSAATVETTTTAAASASLSDIVVTEDDLAAQGVSLDVSEEGAQGEDEYFPVTNFGGPAVNAALGRAGFVDAYDRAFGDVDAVPVDAIGQVRATVLQVEDPSAAQAVLDAQLAGVREGNQTGAGGAVTPVSEIDGLGEAAQTYSVSYSSPPPIVQHLIFWRSGDLVLTIGLVAGPGAPDAEAATRALAHVMQDRIDS